VCLALLSGVLLVLAFPQFDLEPIAWFALIPLFLALEGVPGLVGFGLSGLHGIVFLMGVFWWINGVGAYRVTDFLLSGLYLGAYFGLFGLAYALIARSRACPLYVAAPVLWVTMEYCRSHFLFLNLPWALLGHSQYLNLPVIQVAAVTGVFGISALIVLVNATGARLLLDWTARRGNPLTDRPWPLLRIAAPALVACAAVGSYGWLVLSLPGPRIMLPVAVIQPNIPQADKWNPLLGERNLSRHVELTREAARGSARLIVWPEAATQRVIQQDPQVRSILSDLARELHTSLVIGSSPHPKFYPREFAGGPVTNSAVLFSENGALADQYHKIQLVPFAEYLPYRDVLPWPAHYRGGASHFVPGSEHTVFTLGDLRFSTVICWETIFPDLIRDFARQGIHFLVNIGNEARFGDTAAPHQFLAMTVFRAVEHHIAVARSVNTGVSAMIDPYGRFVSRVADRGKETFVSGIATGMIPVSTERTFYTRFGDVFAFLCAASSAVLLEWARWGRRRPLFVPALIRSEIAHDHGP
jgi:apolipoprotein N-acyltransferase